MKLYVHNIWKARYFWTHLALSDLRSRWRRSFIGILWSILQPLGLSLLLAVVFSHLFHTEIIAYIPYILSGIITWDYITASLTGGSTAFVQADAYIKHCKHPLIIYTLRLLLSNLVVLMMSSIVLWLWSGIILTKNFNWSWLSIITFFPLIFMMTWPLASILAYYGARFRDIPHGIGLVLQSFWFISPVYFDAKLFRNGGLGALMDYNPIYHLLQIIRAPIINGEWPTLENYLFCLGAALLATLTAIFVGRTSESKVIFYL